MKKRILAFVLSLTLVVVGAVGFIQFGYENDNNALNKDTGEYYYGQLDNDGSLYATNEESLKRILLEAVTNGYSTERLEAAFSRGNGLWLKQILIEYGKYPMNPISITEWEKDGKYWAECIGAPGYIANLSIGNEYSQNTIINGYYYVDGKVSNENKDTGKPVDISMLVDWKSEHLAKYLYHPEEILTADYSDQRVVTTLANVTVKDIPHPTGKALGSVTAGTIMEVTGITSNGWFRVNYNGQEAYIYYMFLG